MMNLADWANVLLFPGCVLAAVLVAFLVQRRDEVRWAREAREQKGEHFPAE